MSALKTPAPDAHPLEWGALAVSIPGWRFPDGTHWAAPGFVASATGCSPVFDVAKYARAFFPVYPDPDHWAWWGWFIVLLGPSISMIHRPSSTVGRACIASAAARGGWPGGEG
jgi:hypothetical protein